MSNKVVAGNRGDSIRSDCYIELELAQNGGIQINLQSKVKTLFGDAIIKLCKDELKFFRIRNCNISIEDTGALDYVLAARI